MLDRSDSLSTLAFRKIEKMILAGELKPGERLNEYRFASAHGLSRGPVREACRALEHAGLIVSVPAKGFYVREVSEDQLSEVYDLRAVITGLMCSDATRNATKRSIGKLRRLNDEMREAAENGIRDEYYQLNLEFHAYIAQLAKNETAKRIYDGLIRETHAHRIAVVDTDATIAEHTAITDAIEAGDAEAARRLGEEHVWAGKRRWREKRAAQVGSDRDSNKRKEGSR